MTLLLAACGGRSDVSADASGGTGSKLLPETVVGAPGFEATVTSAPNWGAYVCSPVTLEVRGRGMRNVELLPANSYTPIYGTFTVSDDGTLARYQFDPRNFPNGEMRVRISVFDAPAGQPANEIALIPQTPWLIANGTWPCQSPGSGSGQGTAFTASLASAPADSTYVCSMTTLEVRGNRLKNVELLPADSYTPIHGRFTISEDGKVARLEFDPRKWPNGNVTFRISAFDAAPGQPANEIVAMPARTWRIANGVWPCVSPGTSTHNPTQLKATLTSAPADGSYICSMATLEVLGDLIKNVELLPPSGYTPIYGRFTVSEDGRVARMQLDPRQWPNGELRARISVFDAPPGQPANEIVLTDRTWRIANNTTPCVSPGSSTAGN